MPSDEWSLCRFLKPPNLILAVFVLSVLDGPQLAVICPAQVRMSGDTRAAAQFSNETREVQALPSATEQNKQPDIPRPATKVQSKKPDRSGATTDAKGAGQHSSIEENKQKALTLLENVLLGVDKIGPLEYRVLTQVEAATVLWSFDKERALPLLSAAVNTTRRALEEKKQSTEVNSSPKSKEQLLWFLVIRKVTALQPDLVSQLLSEDHTTPKVKTPIRGIWTGEARAMLSVATEMIDKDPRQAALTAEQALQLGLANYLGFLQSLGKRNNEEAERLAVIIIDRFRDSSVSPIEIRNLLIFVSAPERSLNFKNYYYRALAVRLRREIRPDASVDDLADALGIARTMSRVAGRDSTNWQQEYESIGAAIASQFKERSLALPVPPGRIEVGLTSLSGATPGDTSDIRDALSRAASIKDVSSRNREYQKLAAASAFKADKPLAEEIMSRIDDDAILRETTTQVYSALVRSAIGDSAWSQAQRLASLIQDPLARTLVFANIAERMAKAREDRISVIDAYSMALNKLHRDDPTDRVAKAFLLVAQPLLELDWQRGVDAIKSAGQTVARLHTASEPFQESNIGAGASNWIRYTDPALTADESLNLPDLVTSTFTQIAARDPENAIEIAQWIDHRGMYSLAQLAITKALLRNSTNSPARTVQQTTETKRHPRT